MRLASLILIGLLSCLHLANAKPGAAPATLADVDTKIFPNTDSYTCKGKIYISGYCSIGKDSYGRILAKKYFCSLSEATTCRNCGADNAKETISCSEEFKRIQESGTPTNLTPPPQLPAESR